MSVSLFANQLSSRFNLAWPRYRRLLLPIIIFALLTTPTTREITITVLSDAFWQVSVFVAMTLAVYHVFSRSMASFLKNYRGKYKSYSEVGIASILGMLPGCGGAIIVITQFVSGRMSFGAVTAVLTATMGDAAFLLLAVKPTTGISVMAICSVVGFISGILVNFVHQDNFLRNTYNSNCSNDCQCVGEKHVNFRAKVNGCFWQIFAIPGAFVGLLFAAQIEVGDYFFSQSFWQILGALLGIICVSLWAVSREVTSYESIVAEDFKEKTNKIFQKVALDTNFITSWVVVAFLTFELIMLFGDFDLANLFSDMGAVMPLMAVVVGMIPGCGPQILMTSMYISGAIPLSAQLGNAISNDGDALFPAIALSPKVAIVATFYSSIPALFVAYGCYYFIE